MKTAVSDIETDGFLHELTKLYCSVIIDAETEEVFKFTNLIDYIKKLGEYDEVYFHNGISFDHPALQSLYGAEMPIPRLRFRDTLVLSRLLYPNIATIDAARRRKYRESYTLPGKQTGSHALGAWGHRLGDYKGDFSPADYGCTWKTIGDHPNFGVIFNKMLDYCVQDCWVTLKLLRLLKKKEWPAEAVQLEHDIAWLMAHQVRNGFHFNEGAASDLYAELCGKRAKYAAQLKETFGWWYAPNGQTTPKRTVNYKEILRPDLIEGAVYTKLKVVEFNPGSRKHVARCFKKWYGWEPTEYTDSGEPKVDAEVLEKLDFPEAAPLKDYYDIAKMIGQLAEGDNAWLKLVQNGYIHGSVNPNGAGTGRASHSHPNVAQVPKGKVGSYGYRCRQLFGVPAGWVLLGTDASGLELRCLGNALAPFDGGAYSKIVVDGDVHWVNTLALGLVPEGTVRDKDNPEHEEAREISKRWIYAFLYGAGNELLGEIVGFSEEDVERWREKKAHKKVIGYLKRKGEVITRTRICHILKGEELRAAFLKAIPAVKEFQQACKALHKDDKKTGRKGGIIGLDGRFIRTRSAHSATNFRLQGDGALVCKKWGVELERMLLEKGLRHGWDGDFAFCAWVHDEYQIACRTKEIATIVGETAKEAMALVGKAFNFACQLDADYDVGTCWAETH